MDAQEILGRLDKVRKNGTGWIARCPAHDDKNPSLSVTEKDGRVLLKCHAGCPTERVVSALGMEMRDLMPGSGTGRRAVATYDYTDRDGALLFQVLRYEPKAFRARRPTGDGWTWNLDGVSKVPYNWPEVAAAIADGRTVWVCEGEKDADAVARLGACATTNALGAKNWPEECTEALRGADVVVIVDRDEAGYARGEQLQRALLAHARSVKVVEPRQGKDAHEHLMAGLGLEDFTPVGEAKPLAVCFADVVEKQTQWLWKPYIPKGEPTLLAGDGGIAKTHIALALCASITKGIRLAGSEPLEQGKVLYVTAEDDIEETLAARFRMLNGDKQCCFALDKDWMDDRGDWYELIRREVERIKPSLIVFDPVQAFFSVNTNCNQVGHVRGEMVRFRSLAREFAATVLLISHLNKMTGANALYRVNGSQELVNAARSVLLAGRVNRQDEEVYAMGHLKSNKGPRGTSLGYEIDDGGEFRWLGPSSVSVDDISLGEQKSTRADEAADWLRGRLQPGPVAQARIAEDAKRAGLSMATLRRAKVMLGIESVKASGCWIWSLPRQGAQGAHTGRFEHLDLEPRAPDAQAGNPIELADGVLVGAEGGVAAETEL